MDRFFKVKSKFMNDFPSLCNEFDRISEKVETWFLNLESNRFKTDCIKLNEELKKAKTVKDNVKVEEIEKIFRELKRDYLTYFKKNDCIQNRIIQESFILETNILGAKLKSEGVKLSRKSI
jgi:hypothetical protein